MGAGLGLSTIGGSPEIGIPMMTSGMGQIGGGGQKGPAPPPPTPAMPKPPSPPTPSGAPALGQASVPQVPQRPSQGMPAGGPTAMNPQQMQLLRMMGGTQ